jgi:hypothetical protein
MQQLVFSNGQCNAPSGALGSPTRTREVTRGNSEGTGFNREPSTRDSGEGSGVTGEECRAQRATTRLGRH